MLEIENAQSLETIFYACLECGRTDWAKVVFKMLKQHAPDMPKTMRLEAFLLNAEDKSRDAYQRLHSILKAAPADAKTWRALISLKHVKSRSKLSRLMEN